MREAAADGENSTALAAIRVLALTGFRRGEVLGLKPEMLLRGGVTSCWKASCSILFRRPAHPLKIF